MNIDATRHMLEGSEATRQRVEFLPRTCPASSDSRGQKNTAQVNALAIVAHDLRGPLASISALMDLIDLHSTGHDAGRVSRCTQRATDIVDCLNDMLNAILERVKTTGDPLGIRPSLVNITDVMERAVSLNQPTADRRNVALNLVEAGPLTLSGDECLLLQASENLISNAVKYSPAGGTVTCSVEQHENLVAIRIANQGTGFSETDIRRGFQPFTKLSARSAADARSWGLGLWIVRLITEGHGGRITVKPSNRRGDTEVTLSLPTSQG